MRSRYRLRAGLALTAVLLAIGSLLAPAAAGSAATPPAPIPVPGGIAAHATQATGCGAGNVCIVKATTGSSCTGYSSQTTAPATIRVLVHSGSTVSIKAVAFETYVENVLPDEWIGSWDGEALKAGAIAVKSYAWYWVTHYGGYIGPTRSPSTCFDVTDDTNFQVYKAGSAQTRATNAVTSTWGVAARKSGKIVQTFYRADLHSSSEACGAYADGTTASQYGTQTCAEAGYNYVKILEAYYGSSLQLASTRQLRTPDDFVFNQRSTRAVFDPAKGNWAINDAYGTTLHFGTAGDIPTVMTTGDGLAVIGVYRPKTGTWYQAAPNGAVAHKTAYGVSTDIPAAAHYNGLSRPSVLAVFRPYNGTWHILGQAELQYGTKGDIPVPGHYTSTADTAATPAVFRPSAGIWYMRGRTSVQWGGPGDIPVPGDYNGDGITDPAVYRPSNHRWYVYGSASVQWGVAGDVPVVGDYTGDGRTDITIYRPSTHQWYVHGSTTVAFGAKGNAPVGAAPLRQ